MKRIKRSIKHFFILVFSNPRAIAALSATAAIALLFTLDYAFFLSKENASWMTFVASVHGIFFDALIFCLVAIAFYGARDRLERIRKYNEELDDFRFLDSREGIIRKESIIRKLSKLKAKAPHMKGMVIEGADLSGVRLHGADLTEARLSNTDFSNAMLNGVRFNVRTCGGGNPESGASPRAAVCAGATFAGTWLCDSDIHGMDLGSINFEKARLSRSNIASTSLRRSVLRFANLEDSACEGADFRGADLYESVFTGASMQRAQFSQEKDKSWDDSNCAKMQHVHMANANLREAFLSYIDMRHSDLNGTVFLKARMKQVNLGWSKLKNAVLCEADMEGADFLESELVGADFCRANLRKAKNLTLGQLRGIKTLYLAGLDNDLIELITRNGLTRLLTEKK